MGAARRPRARRFLAAALLAVALLLPAPPGGPPNAAAAPVLELEPVVTGLAGPVLVTHAGDERLFIVEQTGRIRVLSGGNVLTFLDIEDRVLDGGERGLLGLAFHPQYASNGRFFVFYTRSDGDLQISEFERSAGDANAADTTERELLRIEHSANTNHNGGMLAFGPDGKLYIGTGDGGGRGDPLGSGQNINSQLGKILRMDVDVASPATQPPSDNPFVGITGDDLVWSLGLRNPWRFSFDRATGDLWVADVGQGSWEEVNRATAASGHGRGVNFGWNVMEGAHCYNATSCNQSGLTLPLAEYGHGSGDCSVTGGYVYRGSAAPALAGRYLFGDYCSGRIWSVSAGGPATQTPMLLADTSHNITSFGEDAAGHVYVVAHAGAVYRLGTVDVSRVSGADRYATAAALSAETFAPGVPAVLVATGENYPDALAGAAAAAAWDGPVLLVRRTSIPQPVAAELDRLDPGRILVLGGPGVISDAVAGALGAYTAGGVTRLAGADRYETSALVSAATFAAGPGAAIIATGENYADALGAGAIAAAWNGPVLLVRGGSIPPAVTAELQRLNPGRILVLGGPAVVSDAVAAALDAHTTGPVVRLAGADRYGTSAAASTYTFGTGVPVAYVATGQNFPDALAGSAAAGHEGGPLLIVRGGSIPDPVAAELDRLDPARIVVLGGSAVVSDAVAAALAGYVAN